MNVSILVQKSFVYNLFPVKDDNQRTGLPGGILGTNTSHLTMHTGSHIVNGQPINRSTDIDGRPLSPIDVLNTPTSEVQTSNPGTIFMS